MNSVDYHFMYGNTDDQQAPDAPEECKNDEEFLNEREYEGLHEMDRNNLEGIYQEE